MAISLISVGTPYAPTATSNTHPIPYPGTFVVGDLLVMVATIRTDGQTLDTPSGWTLQYSDVSSGTGPRLNTYTRTATGSESGSETLTSSGTTSGAGVMVALRGVDTTSPIVAAAGSDDNTTNTDITLTGATATAADQWIIAAAAAQYTNTTLRTWSAPAGMTERADVSSNESGGSNVNLFVGTEPLTASGATGTRLISGSANTLRRVGRLIILAVAPVSAPPLRLFAQRGMAAILTR